MKYNKQSTRFFCLPYIRKGKRCTIFVLRDCMPNYLPPRKKRVSFIDFLITRDSVDWRCSTATLKSSLEEEGNTYLISNHREQGGGTRRTDYANVRPADHVVSAGINFQALLAFYNFTFIASSKFHIEANGMICSWIFLENSWARPHNDRV